MWPFRRKRASRPVESLTFRDNRAFFEYTCQFGQTKLEKGKGIVGIVLQDQGALDDGKQVVVVRIAADDGGFDTLAPTASAKEEKLLAEDLVIWIPIEHRADIGEEFGDSRCGWIGMIKAKISNKSDVSKMYPEITAEY